jgi:hypothetical protein
MADHMATSYFEFLDVTDKTLEIDHKSESLDPNREQFKTLDHKKSEDLAR